MPEDGSEAPLEAQGNIAFPVTETVSFEATPPALAVTPSPDDSSSLAIALDNVEKATVLPGPSTAPATEMAESAPLPQPATGTGDRASQAGQERAETPTTHISQGHEADPAESLFLTVDQSF